MIKLLIEKEMREILHSTRFAITFGVCSLLIVLSFYVGAKNYAIWERQYEAARRETLRQLDGLTDWFSVQQHRVFLPPQPLAALVSGVSNDVGRTIEVRGRGELSTDDSRFNEDPIFAVFRFLDLDFIFQIILSLFAILFAYDAISGEKERGTLKLSFANAVPREKYILGKLCGSCLAAGLPLLMPMLAGCLLLISLGVPLSADDWTRLGLIIGAGFLYFGVFLALSVLVSTLTKRTSSAFLILLVAWILMVLIIPRTSVILAGGAVNVPSVDEVASQKSRFNAQLWSEDRKKMAAYTPEPGAEKDMGKTMQQFNRFMQQLADERDKKMQEFSERLNEERENRQEVQQRTAFGIARISPAATFSFAASRLAGTSLTMEERFKSAASAYQKQFAAFLKEKTGMVAGGRMVMMRRVVEDGKKPAPINPNDLPEFVYQPATVHELFGPSIFDLGLLAFFMLLFFFGSYIAFLRYDMR